MNAFRAGALLALAVLIAVGSSGPMLAVEVSRHSDRCRILASTGKSEAGRDREFRTTCARVDDQAPSHLVRHPQKKHERPIDRLRSRGEGRPKASGDKGARHQLHRHTRSRHPHARHPRWHW